MGDRTWVYWFPTTLLLRPAPPRRNPHTPAGAAPPPWRFSPEQPPGIERYSSALMYTSWWRSFLPRLSPGCIQYVPGNVHIHHAPFSRYHPEALPNILAGSLGILLMLRAKTMTQTPCWKILSEKGISCFSFPLNRDWEDLLNILLLMYRFEKKKNT